MLGNIHWAVRWKMSRCSTSGAIVGAIWKPEAPAPIWATRLPERSIPSGHRAEWNDGATRDARRRPWTPATAPDGAEEVIGADGWLDAALEAIPRLAGCRYFDSPVTLIQFTSSGFVQKVLGGQYDAPKTPKGGGGDKWQGDKPEPLDGWTPAQRRALAEQMRVPT